MYMTEPGGMEAIYHFVNLVFRRLPNRKAARQSPTIGDDAERKEPRYMKGTSLYQHLHNVRAAALASALSVRT